jgi:preprotein translocase subunit SecA
MLMRAATLPVPGLLLGTYPERIASERDFVAGLAAQGADTMAQLSGLANGRHKRFLTRVRAAEKEFHGLPAKQLPAKLAATRAAISREGLTESLLARAFAVVRSSCVHTLGVRPFDTQLIAARIMMDNRLAEMATGEGKTLAAAVCAGTAALAGIPVHVITANDYLVARDTESMQPLYSALGLTVAAVTQSLDRDARRDAYDADITYCTAKELVFDYLRDHMVRQRQKGDLVTRAARVGSASSTSRKTLLRGLCMAIVDEADSILIDEARVPLILSEVRTNPHQRQHHRQARWLASQLTVNKHFRLQPGGMAVELTKNGSLRAERLAAAFGKAWLNRLHREELVRTALAAQHLYKRDRHYLVLDGKVAIIDETTGRLSEGRVWSRGLHQLIELKENCETSGDQVTVAQITYQRFFQRYLRLGGMSGTLREARGELHTVYGLCVTKVPLRRPSRRKSHPARLFPNREALWRAVVTRAGNIGHRGRPVLIGTDSVAASEDLSRQLSLAGLDHAVLNARNDEKEAEIVSQAGRPGRITVATNMAGRGTDIPLDKDVAADGGLHVISCQHNASRRIDRQLIGRCARQGDPGSTETMLSMDQSLIARLIPAWIGRCVSEKGLKRPMWLVGLAICAPQIMEEGHQKTQRADMLKHDLRADRELAIGGHVE